MPPDESEKGNEASAKPPADTAPANHAAAVTSASPAPNPTSGPPKPAAPTARPSGGLRRLLLGGAVVLVAALYFGVPIVLRALNTESTDDAYVNGHVTFVAARVSGQVTKVLVDDNYRVRAGELLVQLDKEPYQVVRNSKQAAVEVAQADLLAAENQVRAYVAQARSNRFKLQHATELVDDQLALLRSNVAQLKVEQANLALAKQDYARGEALVPKGALSQQQFDQYKATLEVARNRVNSAEQTIQQTRAGLGLPIDRENPLDVPPDLTQTFSTVRQALADLLQSAAPLGIFPLSYDATPKQAIEEFYKRDPEGNLDRIYAKLMRDAPILKQAQSKLVLAERDLAQADLNLRYCDVFAEISGVVTRRNVNPGNNVQAGQALMAIRSLTEIWIDANFKETQLAELRIGQRAELEIDMYGRHRIFEGRITGFTMGTGTTLALLPAQNATGNFIKVVQRLPVRIELTDYDPDNEPLFVGLSVVPHVFFKEAAVGPNAGKVLRPDLPPPAAEKPSSSTGPKP